MAERIDADKLHFDFCIVVSPTQFLNLKRPGILDLNLTPIELSSIVQMWSLFLSQFSILVECLE